MRSGRLEARTQTMPPAIAAVAHLLGHHAIDAAGNTRVAGLCVASSERLVGLVDEDEAAPERGEQAEDFLEIALGAADPLVAKVLHLHHRHAGLAGEALDDERLAGADGAAEEIAHGQRREIVLPPERDVLAQPLF